MKPDRGPVPIIYFSAPALTLAALCPVLPEPWVYWGPVTIFTLVTLMGEWLSPHGLEAGPAYPPAILNGALWLNIPVLFLFLWACLMDFGAGHGQGGTIRWYHEIGLVFGMAFAMAMNGTNIAHELLHRRDSPGAAVAGRMLAALSFDWSLPVTHREIHHAHLGTGLDPASPEPGRSFWTFAARSIIFNLKRSLQLEGERLRRRTRPALHWQNRVLQTAAFSLAWVALAFVLAGGRGLALMVLAGGVARFFHEMNNYVAHYGLSRGRSSHLTWDHNSLFISGLLYNLNRHAAHHENGALPYWELVGRAGQPVLPLGYTLSFWAAMIPPLWFRMMDPAASKVKAEGSAVGGESLTS